MLRNIFTLISIIFSVSLAQAQASNLMRLSHFEGCYIGVDQIAGLTYRGRISIDKSIGSRELLIDNEMIDYITLKFFNDSNHVAMITQIFNAGKLIDSSTLNNYITYQFDGVVKRTINGEFLAESRLTNTVAFKHRNYQDIEISVSQNIKNNSWFWMDEYIGYQASHIRALKLTRISCN